MTFLRRTRNWFILLAVFIFLFGAVTAWRYRPALMVNGHTVSARDVSTNERLARSYYAHVADTYNSFGVNETAITAVEDILRERVLTELVVRTLIHNALEEELGDEILSAMIYARVGRLVGDRAIQEATKGLYDAQGGEALAHIFIPEAEKDIFSAKLFLNGDSFDEWIQKRKQESSVKVFIFGYLWNGDSVTTDKSYE